MLDMQITTAKAYPRNPNEFVMFATQRATPDEETAQTCSKSASPKVGQTQLMLAI